ncbi:MAG: M20/M25/M40 family metallo-hydrolase [Candidatus Bipolaricaulia bacterium]
MTAIAEVDWSQVGDEATWLLSELLQIDTTNPPGNERAAADHLRRFLENEGIQSEFLEKEPGRTNLLARLKGSRPGPTLMLLSHTDVVPATNPDDWEQPPFSGSIDDDGFIWGRGALDMKSVTAMETLAFALFKRAELDFAGELVLLSVADEEMGGTYGARWLTTEHSDKVQADYVLNEMGGLPLQLGDRTFYTIETVEKGLWWVKVRVTGTAGHGSMPHDDNPLVKSSQFIQRIAEHRFPRIVSPAIRSFVETTAEAFGPQGPEIAGALLDSDEEPDLPRLFGGSPISPWMVNAFLRTTCSPTKIEAGLKENVIPDACEFVLDFRYVPGYSQAEIEGVLRSIADDLGIEIELETLQANEASESPVDHDFYRTIEATVREEIPEAEPVPYMLTGATDSRFMRDNGSIAYGFAPLSTRMSMAERAALIHNDNERIDQESLELGVRLLSTVAMKTLDAR